MLNKLRNKLKNKPLVWYLMIPVMAARVIRHKLVHQPAAPATNQLYVRDYEPIDLSSVKLRTLTAEQITAIEQVTWWHRIRLGRDNSGNLIYSPGFVNHGPDGTNWPTKRFGLPADLSGKTVLDIGCWDGFFSFEAEARGAKCVVGADFPTEKGGHWGGTKGFDLAHKILGSKVEYREIDITQPNPQFEAFDVVLCYGVLYHIPRFEQALSNLRTLTKPGGECLIETAAVGPEHGAVWEYRPNQNNDPTNYWYPSLQGLTATLKFAGFSEVQLISEFANRITVRAT